MVNTIIAMPYRAADERRQELFNFTTTWLTLRHPIWPIHLGTSDDGPFNRGQAINNAITQSEDWDVVVVHDADNISDPATLRHAVELAHTTGKVIYPFETYTYLDEHSSNQLMGGGTWFLSPELHPQHTFRTTVRHKHYSGVQVIPRAAYEAVGGYIELSGWGAEDAIMNTLFDTFAQGSQWLPGGAYHLWHSANRNDPRDRDNIRNHKTWLMIQTLAKRSNPAGAVRKYLATIGHHVP